VQFPKKEEADRRRHFCRGLFLAISVVIEVRIHMTNYDQFVERWMVCAR